MEALFNPLLLNLLLPPPLPSMQCLIWCHHCMGPSRFLITIVWEGRRRTLISHLPLGKTLHHLKPCHAAISCSLYSALTGVRHGHITQCAKGGLQLVSGMPCSSTTSWKRITHRLIGLLPALSQSLCSAAGHNLMGSSTQQLTGRRSHGLHATSELQLAIWLPQQLCRLSEPAQDKCILNIP